MKQPITLSGASHFWGWFGWFTLGFAQIIPYAYALLVQDLRQHIVVFEIVFFVACCLYALAAFRVLRVSDDQPASKQALVVIFLFGVAFRVLVIFTPPTLSDDMYRYIWDGRVQASGVHPYNYPPDAPELRGLRDDTIWPLINRKSAVTVYPAGAEFIYGLLWRIWPDSVRWFQIVMAAGGIVAGLILVPLLRIMGRPASQVLIFLWCPLVVFETAHSAHVDGLILPLLAGAWLARAKGRDGLTGLLLGAATALKLYPIILLPALWRPRDAAGRNHPSWLMPLGCAAMFTVSYIPYLSQGIQVVGYLPQYLAENFNMGLTYFIAVLVQWVGGQPDRVLNSLLALTLVMISLVLVLRPAKSPEQAIRRCMWPMGAFALLAHNLHPWYLLWSVPLVAMFVQRGRLGVKLDAWAGWALFGCLIALSYTYYIENKTVIWTSFAQFVPLYVILLRDWIHVRKMRSTDAASLVSHRQAPGARAD